MRSRRTGPAPWRPRFWAIIAPRSGSRIVTPDNRDSVASTKFASPMFFATFNTPSTAATRAVAPKIRDHLRWAVRVGRRRPELKDTTLAAYAAQAERRLDRLLGVPAAHPAGRELQRQIKAWRGEFFVFLADRRVPPTNNVSER